MGTPARAGPIAPINAHMATVINHIGGIAESNTLYGSPAGQSAHAIAKRKNLTKMLARRMQQVRPMFPSYQPCGHCIQQRLGKDRRRRLLRLLLHLLHHLHLHLVLHLLLYLLHLHRRRSTVRTPCAWR